jgi:hypothetical protein
MVEPGRSRRVPRMGERSITRPSSHRACPATACPPPRTAAASSRSRAKRTAAITSATPVQRAMSAGRRSICPFQIFRAWSYPPSSGVSSSPRKSARSPSRAVVSMWADMVPPCVSAPARHG